MSKFKIIAASVILAIGMIGLGLSIRSGINSISRQSRTVSVRGLAEREVDANKVTWPIVYKLVGDDLSTLYNEIQHNNKSIIKYLTDNGVKESEITVNAPEVIDKMAERYGSLSYKENRYNVTSVLVVVSSEVDLIRRLIANQGELLKQGIVVTDGGYQYQVQFEFTELNLIKPEMIAQATANAREAGERFAIDSESKLGKIKTADQGQFTINDRDPNTPFIKRIRVVTRIDFYLED